MSVIDEIKKHASEMELSAISFLDAHGHYVKHKHEIKKVKLEFIDGKIFQCTNTEFSHLEHINFSLRPSKDDA